MNIVIHLVKCTHDEFMCQVNLKFKSNWSTNILYGFINGSWVYVSFFPFKGRFLRKISKTISLWLKLLRKWCTQPRNFSDFCERICHAKIVVFKQAFPSGWVKNMTLSIKQKGMVTGTVQAPIEWKLCFWDTDSDAYTVV